MQGVFQFGVILYQPSGMASKSVLFYRTSLLRLEIQNDKIFSPSPFMERAGVRLYSGLLISHKLPQIN